MTARHERKCDRKKGEEGKDYLLGERGGYETSPQGAALVYESRFLKKA